MLNEKGLSLLELVVSIAITSLVLGSLVFAVITSIRNAQFAKNQTQATKLAQEGIEKVRSLRDRGNNVDTLDFQRTLGNKTFSYNTFNSLWSFSSSAEDQKFFACSEGYDNCYFYFNSSNILHSGTSLDTEEISNGSDGEFFKRQILIEDTLYRGDIEKKITVIVKWNDINGEHESRLTTFLRNLNQ